MKTKQFEKQVAQLIIDRLNDGDMASEVLELLIDNAGADEAKMGDAAYQKACGEVDAVLGRAVKAIEVAFKLGCDKAEQEEPVGLERTGQAEDARGDEYAI